jgi:hypothetical protein
MSQQTQVGTKMNPFITLAAQSVARRWSAITLRQKAKAASKTEVKLSAEAETSSRKRLVESPGP